MNHYEQASQRLYGLGYGNTVLIDSAKISLMHPHLDGTDITVVASRRKAVELLADGDVEGAQAVMREVLPHRFHATGVSNSKVK